jgi:hypothetical protein
MIGNLARRSEQTENRGVQQNAYPTPRISARLSSSGPLWSIQMAALARNDGYPNEIVYEVLDILKHTEMHYESMLGYFQMQSYRPNTPTSSKRSYHALYAWFSRVASEIISNHQAENYLRLTSPEPVHKRGLGALVQENRPLWIFSLNYDSAIECIATAGGIELHSGFTGRKLLPRRNQIGVEIGKLEIETISEEEISRHSF